MGTGHSHAPTGAGNERRLWWALALTSFFLVAEVVGGLLFNSLALLSDAAHMFTDTAALAIALTAIQTGKRPADKKRTFGYYRFEILAAAFNAVLLVFVALYIIYEAWRRFSQPPEIHSLGMLAVALVGLVVNFISLRLLSAGRDANLNVKGAYLEVWSDLLGSLGVIIAALLIRATGWLWVDALVAVGIGLWVLPRTWVLLKESVNILLQGVPEGIDLEAIEAAIRAAPGVAEVHDLHVWAMTSGKNVLTAHLVIGPEAANEQRVLTAVDAALKRFHITHSTVQVEAAGHHACATAHDHVH